MACVRNTICDGPNHSMYLVFILYKMDLNYKNDNCLKKKIIHD